MGCSAIQFAVATGLTVVTTASEANHTLLKSLGAAQVLDYKGPSIIDDLVSILNEGDLSSTVLAVQRHRHCVVKFWVELEEGSLP